MMRRAIREMPVGFRLFLNRSKVVPFEFAVGFASVYIGAVSFLGGTAGAQAANQALPPLMVAVLNLIYLLSGFFIIFGLGWGYRNLEASGVILLFTALIARLVMLIVITGFTLTTTATAVQGGAFAVACIVRLISLMKNRVLVFAEDIPNIVKEQTRGLPE